MLGVRSHEPNCIYVEGALKDPLKPRGDPGVLTNTYNIHTLLLSARKRARVKRLHLQGDAGGGRRLFVCVAATSNSIAPHTIPTVGSTRCEYIYISYNIRCTLRNCINKSHCTKWNDYYIYNSLLFGGCLRPEEENEHGQRSCNLLISMIPNKDFIFKWNSMQADMAVNKCTLRTWVFACPYDGCGKSKGSLRFWGWVQLWFNGISSFVSKHRRCYDNQKCLGGVSFVDVDDSWNSICVLSTTYKDSQIRSMLFMLFSINLWSRWRVRVAIWMPLRKISLRGIL